MKTLLDSNRRFRLYDPIGDGQSFDELIERAKAVEEAGRLARRNGCHRVLANPSSDTELSRWLRGWDDEDRELKEKPCSH